MNRLLHVPFRGLDVLLARQKAIEASVLENANRVAAARVDELRRTDPVRARGTFAQAPLFWHKKTALLSGFSGDNRVRTCDLPHVKRMLSQLSYISNRSYCNRGC